MKKLKNDFNANSDKDSYYDIREDWNLIESSLAKQYGIRIRNEKSMPWEEFCSLLTGLMSDTPLGQIVSIRAEKDPKTIKGFSPEQKRVHSAWRSRKAEKALEDPEKLNRDMDNLAKMLESMFKG